MEEKIIEVDRKDNHIGIRPRSDFYEGKHIHRASHLVLLNPLKEILIQKRSQKKKWYPGLYDFSVGGTVGDESYTDCIKREINEELRITFPVKKSFKYFTEDSGIDVAWRTVFVGITDKEVRPNQDEIEKVLWISPISLERDIEQNPQNYAPHFLQGLEIYFNRQ